MNHELYDLIDQDESLTDEEKREAYEAELENTRMQEEWEENY